MKHQKEKGKTNTKKEDNKKGKETNDISKVKN
jgi:hypothetical protein